MVGLPCAALDAVLAVEVSRRRRVLLSAGALGGFAVSGVVGVSLEAWRIVAGSLREPQISISGVFGVAVGAGLAVLAFAVAAAARSTDEERLARELDRRLGLPDTTATALALSRGRIASPLGRFVLAQAEPELEAARPRVHLGVLVEPAWKRVARIGARWAILLWALLLALVIVDLLRLLNWPFGLLARGPNDVGIVAQPDPSVDRQIPAPRGANSGNSGHPAPSPVPADTPPPDAPHRPPPVAEPPDAEEPDVRAKAKPAREVFRDSAPVLVVVSAKPTRELPRDRVLRLSLELDGKETGTSVELRVGPSAPLGVGEIQDLRRLPAFAGALTPGEHTVRARLSDDAGSFASEPAKFRIEGDEKGGGGAGSQPNPQQPDPQQPKPDDPKPEPPSAPPPPAPSSPPSPRPPAGRAPVPEIHPKFDPQAVLPLFGDGPEVQKRGPTVVLVPGGGPDVRPETAPPQRADLAEALPDAVKRAETDVDRAGLRRADRDLVRRYFEELARGLR